MIKPFNSQSCDLMLNPKIMGVLNITPDSMYDGGWYTTLDAAMKRVESMIAEGVDIIDVGGESTRPAANLALMSEEELYRVLPVIEAIRARFDIPLSIDTSQPLVMREAVNAGVNMINDVRALQVPGALETAAQLNVPVCLMHMSYPFGKADNTVDPLGNEPVAVIKKFFSKRLEACEQAGIKRENIILDPGFGTGNFGKSCEQNLIILKNLAEFNNFNLPLLIGVSYKTFISEVLNVPLEERLPGALAATVLAVERGANIIRTHDIKATKEVVQLTAKLLTL